MSLCSVSAHSRKNILYIHNHTEELLQCFFFLLQRHHRFECLWPQDCHSYSQTTCDRKVPSIQIYLLNNRWRYSFEKTNPVVCGVTTCDWQWSGASSDFDLRLTWILIGGNQWEEHRDKYINESPVYKPTIVIVVFFPTQSCRKYNFVNMEQ